MKNIIKKILRIHFLKIMLMPFVRVGFYIVFLLKRIFTKNHILNADFKESEEYLNKLRTYKHMEKPQKELNYSNKCDLSIVIPCYNSSKYIDECIFSLINQKTNYNYEIICVNDGSTDDTLEKLKKYGNTIILINQKNSGAAAARNVGIEISNGKYIAFIDSDDYVTKDFIEVLLNDIIIKDLDHVYGDFNILSQDGSMQRVSGKSYICGGIYKKNIFSQIRFPIDNVYEDSIQAFLLSPTIKLEEHIDVKVYIYRQNNNGITNTSVKTYKCLDTIYVVKILADYAKENNLSITEDIYKNILFHYSSIMYNRIKYLDKKTKENAFVFASFVVKKYKPTKEMNLNYKLKLTEKYLLEGNISKWELSCKYLK